MSRESVLVFVKFVSIILATLFLMIVVNSLASRADSSTETPWRTLNPAATDVHHGRIIMERNGCFSCHSVDGFGGRVGPELNGVRKRKTNEELFKWIKSPWSVKPGTRMPQFNLSNESILKIVSYLETKDSIQVSQ